MFPPLFRTCYPWQVRDIHMVVSMSPASPLYLMLKASLLVVQVFKAPGNKCVNLKTCISLLRQ